MNALQRAAGVAALAQAFAYLAGFAIFALLLDSSAYVGPARKVAFMLDHRVIFQAALVITYLVTGIAMVVLTAGLHKRLRDRNAALMPGASPLGYIWAGLILASGMIALVGMQSVVELYGQDRERAATVWQTVGIVQNGLGGGIEIVGGLWVLLVSLAGRRSGLLPGWLFYLGMLVGTAGVLKVNPGIDMAVELFGVGMILWFASVGLSLLFAKQADATAGSLA